MKASGGRGYLQIVENRREDGVVRQQVIATLVRLEDLRESGQLERLLRSGARFADKAIVVGAVADGEATTSPARRIGAALVLERLWEETGCRAVVESLAGSRRHDFPLERAVFLSVLHRLFSGGSDRAAERWRQRGRRGPRPASPLPRHGLARRRTRRRPAGGRNAVCAELPEGRHGGGAVRAAA
jgi:hypothetical protein